MKVYELSGAFGLDNLALTDRPRPEPGPGQVVLRMKAASINYRDVLMVAGKYNPRQPLPLVPFSDGVGEVVEVGPGVGRVSVGQRVIPIFCQGWLCGEPSPDKFKTSLGGPLDGTLQEYMLVDAAGVVAVPDYLSDAEAATLPCAAVTAWHALAEEAPIRPGDVVVCQGTGGVSTFAMQFAQLFGAQTVVTSSSDAKLEAMVDMGAAHTINYRSTEEWGRAVKDWTGGRGADHVIEIGGAKTLEQSVAAVRFGGHISIIGVVAGAVSDLSVVPVLMRNLRLQGVYVGSREMYERMLRAMDVAKMRPHVDRVFGFDALHEAMRFVEAGEHFGKVVVEIGAN